MATFTFALDKASSRSRDADGRMRVKDCILSTAEVNPYRGDEIPNHQGLGLHASRIYQLYRAPEALKDSVASFEGVPLLLKHIPQTADSPQKEYQAGSVHSVTFDGKHLRGDLLISDGYAIDLIESGELADLSCGYRYVLDVRAGRVGKESYDGIMQSIEGNHVALVSEGRATGAHVADSALPKYFERGETVMALAENEPQAKTETEGGMQPVPGSPAAEANEGISVAEFGATLKRILTVLENDRGGARPGMDSETGTNEELPQDPDVSGGAQDEEGTPMPKQAVQEGTPARGGATPHGAMDSTIKQAVAAAVAHERARAMRVETAKRDVRPVLGDVFGMDSAEDIYTEALKHVGMDVSQIAKGAEKMAWDAYRLAIGHKGAAQRQAALALDSKGAEQTKNHLVDLLSKIRVKG